jgi:hypothetical protein
MEEREREEHMRRQQRKYTVLFQEYSELEQEVNELDK